MPIRHFLIAAALLAAVNPPASAQEAAAITNMPLSAFKWEAARQGVAFAPLVGDRFTEPYMAMVRLPAGLVSPPHVKSANMFGMVVAGTISHLAIGADPASEVLLPPGSFYKVPAGLNHISKCVSEVDCLTFVSQDGKFDFITAAP